MRLVHENFSLQKCQWNTQNTSLAYTGTRQKVILLVCCSRQQLHLGEKSLHSTNRTADAQAYAHTVPFTCV